MNQPEQVESLSASRLMINFAIDSAINATINAAINATRQENTVMKKLWLLLFIVCSMSACEPQDSRPGFWLSGELQSDFPVLLH